MAYNLNWYDEARTILYITAEGSVTWDEYHGMIDDALERIEASEWRVDVISDLENRIPHGNPLPHFSEIITRSVVVETFGVLYVVRSSRLKGFVQSVANIAGRVLNIQIAERVAFVSSIEQALEKIYSARGERTPQND